MDRGTWQDIVPGVAKKSDMTERLTLSATQITWVNWEAVPVGPACLGSCRRLGSSSPLRSKIKKHSVGEWMSGASWELLFIH